MNEMDTEGIVHRRLVVGFHMKNPVCRPACRGDGLDYEAVITDNPVTCLECAEVHEVDRVKLMPSTGLLPMPAGED